MEDKVAAGVKQVQGRIESDTKRFNDYLNGQMNDELTQMKASAKDGAEQYAVVQAQSDNARRLIAEMEAYTSRVHSMETQLSLLENRAKAGADALRGAQEDVARLQQVTAALALANRHRKVEANSEGRMCRRQHCYRPMHSRPSASVRSRHRWAPPQRPLVDRAI